MKRNHIVMAVLFIGCAITLMFSQHAPDDPVVEAAPRTHVASTSPRAGSTTTNVANAGIGSLRVRAEPSGAQHRALFGGLWLAPPLPSAAPLGSEMPPLPTGPMPPAMPFTYLGKQSADGRWEVYLGRGDDTLIVREQMVIDDDYRVDTISPPTMTLTYLPLKLVQTLDIGSAD
jgi:hypothetical protein